MAALAETSASFLISDSPINSTMRLPSLATTLISLDQNRRQDQATHIDREPRTEREQLLIAELDEKAHVISLQKMVMQGMQAQTVLHAMYVEGLRGQLQGKEEKKAQGQERGRINTDGMPKILTNNDLFQCVQEGHKTRIAAEEAAANRKDKKTRCLKAVGIWKVREVDRKERNSTLKSQWTVEVRRWEVERDSAKFDQRKAHWTKPKMPTMEKAVPRPKVSDFEQESEASDDDRRKDDEEDGGTNSDGDEMEESDGNDSD
ncbi:hypothetical protein BJ912DRAFT_864635 [Pholiota molesta]|nr:hypothetical protein BJ912DRAFT_864635 [Pholiota molesta]